jgi:hypothetical protein
MIERGFQLLRVVTFKLFPIRLVSYEIQIDAMRSFVGVALIWCCRQFWSNNIDDARPKKDKLLVQRFHIVYYKLYAA